MASAYAALASLMHIIGQLQNHPRPPISLDKEQVESLTQNIVYLQDFLEAYNSHRGGEEVDGLRSRIADAAHAAEDIIESHIADQILAQSTSTHDGRETFISDNLYQDLQKVAQELDVIEKEVMEIKGMTRKPRRMPFPDHGFLCKGIIQRINDHPCPPISLSKKQVKSIERKITFLRSCLEGDTEEEEGLLSRVEDAIYAAEDIIGSRFMNQIVAQSTSHDVENVGSVDLYEDLQKVIEDMDFIKKDVMEIEDKMGIIQDQAQSIVETLQVSPKSTSKEQKTMVGLDDVLLEVMDKLIGEQSDRQIIPIVGMGGIGKTTLARNVYINPLIVQSFDIRAWVTVSQEYNIKEILVEVLLCLKDQWSRDSLSQLSENELGVMLHKSLTGRRYLIILDDMWSIEVWDKVKFFFPNNSNGSRIVMTTRILKLASHLTDTFVLEMKFLDQDKSWSLLCKIVFGEECCPLELEHIGMKIAKNCQGLPLSIVTIGGPLAKSELIQEYWGHVAENLNAIVNLKENKRCLKILHMSYDELPIHLKPYFLYMGTFPEDSKIHASELIKLWVAEGFLKPIRAKSLEEIAEEYLVDLIDRNLIFVSERGTSGRTKIYSIHDLLRDLCVREAWKENFFLVTSKHSLNMTHERRIALHQSKKEYLHSLKFASVTRSLICYDGHADLPLVKFRLLRVLSMVSRVSFYIKPGFQLVNSRYLALDIPLEPNFIFPSTLYLFWNLQTLIIDRLHSYDIVHPLEIWRKPLLRHVKFSNFCLSDPPSSDVDKQDDFVLENLQTLSVVKNFKCSEEVVKRIPNVKKLKVTSHGYEDGFEMGSHYCLYNLGRLNKLEYLDCSFDFSNWPSRNDVLQNLAFPLSLKKLTLSGNLLYWEDMSTKISSSPFLQVLKLEFGPFKGSKWETVEGQFPSLKYLLIHVCEDLEYWTTESTHFPCLEHLVLREVPNLKEIPSDIGDIQTLQSIHLDGCTDSAVISAKRILEEQEYFGNEGLQCTVSLREENDELQSLASTNFQVTSLSSSHLFDL